MNHVYQGSALQLKTNRGWFKTILLSIITCGIYAIIFHSSLGEDLNIVASKRDGKKTMHFCLVYFLLSPITCGIASLIWFHMISERIGMEARSRGIVTSFGAGTYWIWAILGSFIFVGPFIYLHKLCATMNMLCADYNQKGM